MDRGNIRTLINKYSRASKDLGGGKLVWKYGSMEVWEYGY